MRPPLHYRESWRTSASAAPLFRLGTLHGFVLGTTPLFLAVFENVCAVPCHNFPMQFYRRNLPHMQRDYTAHFITFCTKFRRVLPEWARDLVLGCCLHDHERRYRLRVAVVMPDHVHVVLTPLIDESRCTIISLVEIMRSMKGASARRINQKNGKQGAIWQEESFDRVVRSSENLDAKIAYIIENPVRSGLVSDWREYKWIWQAPVVNPFKL